MLDRRFRERQLWKLVWRTSGSQVTQPKAIQTSTETNQLLNSHSNVFPDPLICNYLLATTINDQVAKRGYISAAAVGASPPSKRYFGAKESHRNKSQQVDDEL